MNWLLIVVIVVTLLGGPSTASANSGARELADPAVARGPFEQGRPAPPCAQALNDRRWPEFEPRLEFEEEGVGPAGAMGRPRLCAIYFPREDVYTIALSGVANVNEFRAAKAEALLRLQARGFDLCRITKWLGWGAPNTNYNLDDFYEVGAVCDARVTAGDEGAAEHLPTVHAALGRAIETMAADFGVRPEPPLFILVVTNEAAAAAAYGRYRPNFETLQEAEFVGRRGTPSRLVWGTGTNYLYGNLILINLIDPNQRTTARIEQDVLGQYARFAINQIVGKDPSLTQHVVRAVPTWFDDGLQVRQEYRHTANGASGGFLVEAARAVREGKSPRLAELNHYDQRTTAWAVYGKYPVAAKSYAAVAYLAERHGEESIGRLLVDSRNGSLERFTEQVTRLTGLSLDGLDSAISAWLLDRPRAQAASEDGRIQVELHVFGDGRRAEVVVDEANAACLFDLSGTLMVAELGLTGLVGFSTTLGTDGAFAATRPSTRAGNTVTLTGRLDSSGKLSGTYQVVNEVTACDSGPIAFGTP
jgi:hypothetical protein